MQTEMQTKVGYCLLALLDRQRTHGTMRSECTAESTYVCAVHSNGTRAGQSRAGQGRAGQGRAEQGRAEQGRAGQSRAGQGSQALGPT